MPALSLLCYLVFLSGRSQSSRASAGASESLRTLRLVFYISPAGKSERKVKLMKLISSWGETKRLFTGRRRMSSNCGFSIYSCLLLLLCPSWFLQKKTDHSLCEFPSAIICLFTSCLPGICHVVAVRVNLQLYKTSSCWFPGWQRYGMADEALSSWQ